MWYLHTAKTGRDILFLHSAKLEDKNPVEICRKCTISSDSSWSWDFHIRIQKGWLQNMNTQGNIRAKTKSLPVL